MPSATASSSARGTGPSAASSAARVPDVRDSAVDLELVVEPGSRELLDVVRSHHELAAGLVVQEAEGAEVLDPGQVEIGVVAAVVDDSLRVRVRESDPRPGREGV